MTNETQRSNWLKHHADTVVILGGILGSILWMNGKFNDVNTRLTKIETVLVMRGIMPPSLAITEEKTGK